MLDLSRLDWPELPMALARAHRARRTGDEEVLLVREDLATGIVDDALLGAGFEPYLSAARTIPRHGTRRLRVVRARTLPDTVHDRMRALVCGLNPSLHAADAGVGFVTPSNRFWPAAAKAGLVGNVRDPFDAIEQHRVGMTDLVKRATTRADELTNDEYRHGLLRVERLCARFRPGVVVMVGMAGWRAAADRTALAGEQDRTLAGCPVYVMPSTSGLNAHSRLDDLVEHLRAARRLAA